MHKNGHDNYLCTNPHLVRIGQYEYKSLNASKRNVHLCQSVGAKEVVHFSKQICPSSIHYIETLVYKFEAQDVVPSM